MNNKISIPLTICAVIWGLTDAVYAYIMGVIIFKLALFGFDAEYLLEMQSSFWRSVYMSDVYVLYVIPIMVGVGIVTTASSGVLKAYGPLWAATRAASVREQLVAAAISGGGLVQTQDQYNELKQKKDRKTKDSDDGHSDEEAGPQDQVQDRDDHELMMLAVDRAALTDLIMRKLNSIESFNSRDRYHLVHNYTRIATCIGALFIFSWQIALLAIALLIIVMPGEELLKSKFVYSYKKELSKVIGAINKRLLDVIRTADVIAVHKTQDKEMDFLKNLEENSKPLYSKLGRNEYLIFLLVETLINFTLPLLSLVSYYMIKDSSPSESITVVFALGISFFLLDEVHKSLLELPHLEEKEVEYKNALKDVESVIDPWEKQQQAQQAQQAKGPYSRSSPDGINGDDISKDLAVSIDTSDLDMENTAKKADVVPTTVDKYDSNDGLDHIIIKHVQVRYHPQAPIIIQDLSMTLKKGKIYGIVGESGCGKSSLLKVLAGTVNLTKGSISFVPEQGDSIAVVSQDSLLFRRSIRENVCYGFEDPASVPMEKVLDIMDIVGLTAWIESLPDGLETILEFGERQVSGGQAQRIQLARLFMKDPDIVLLDECLSAIDPTNRVSLLDYFQIFLRGRTVLLITHHEDMLKLCDQVMKFKMGGLIEITDTFTEYFHTKND